MMQLDRTIAPPAVGIEGVQYTSPKQYKLLNGLPIWYLNMGSQEVIKAEFVFHAGSAHHACPLVPSFTSAMMQEGTIKHSASEIADAIDNYGAFLELDHDKDFASITLYTLKRYYAETLPVILEIIEEANLPENEWKILISNRLQKYRINLGKVSFVAGKAFQELVFKGTPYGAPFEEQDYHNVQLNDLLAFRGAHYRLEKSFVMLSGLVDEEVLTSTNQVLGDFPISTPQFFGSTPDAHPVAKQDRIHFIEKTDAIQSAIRIGRRMFDRRHPDYFGVKVLTTVLGGYFGSRLMSNIREDKGYTYGIGAGIVAYENDGWFYISTEVGTDVTSDALIEIYKEVALLRDELIAEDELNLVKNYMLGTLLKSFDGPFERIERFKALHLYHLSDDYYDRYTAAIREVSAIELRDLARKWLQEESLIELVVGKK